MGVNCESKIHCDELCSSVSRVYRDALFKKNSYSKSSRASSISPSIVNNYQRQCTSTKKRITYVLFYK